MFSSSTEATAATAAKNINNKFSNSSGSSRSNSELYLHVFQCFKPLTRCLVCKSRQVYSEHFPGPESMFSLFPLSRFPFLLPLHPFLLSFFLGKIIFTFEPFRHLFCSPIFINFRSRQEMSFLERKEKENCPSLTYGKKRKEQKCSLFTPSSFQFVSPQMFCVSMHALDLERMLARARRPGD